MIIPDLLTQIGHPLGRRGRTSCPIHGGTNTEAFWFSDKGWTCFAGCGSGGLRSLRQALGLEDEPPPPDRTLEGCCIDEAVLYRPRLTTDLTRAVMERREARDRVTAAWHRKLVRIEYELTLVLEVGRTLGQTRPGLLEALETLLGQLWGERLIAFTHAHRSGPWPWTCGCTS